MGKLKDIIIVILSIIAIALFGIVMYDHFIKEEKVIENINENAEKTPVNNNEEKNNEDNNNEEKTQYTYDEVAGEYSFKGTFAEVVDNGSEDGTTSFIYDLILESNGLFSYEVAYDVPFGVIGNYIIDGNKIILNYIYSTGSSTDLSPIKGQKEIIINSKNELEENVTSLQKNLPKIKNEKIILRKTSSSSVSNFNSAIEAYNSDSDY